MACAALAVAATGCRWKQVTATCANVPNPVLLGPVDRVHGHHAASAQATGHVDAEVAETIVSSSHDNVTSTARERDGANKVSFAVVSTTQGRKNEDVRLDGVRAGSWVFIPLAAVKNKFWVGVSGDAVTVQP